MGKDLKIVMVREVFSPSLFFMASNPIRNGDYFYPSTPWNLLISRKTPRAERYTPKTTAAALDG